MGTDKSSKQLSSVLFGKTRQKVLALFYGHPDESFYMRQVVRSAAVGQGTVQRELKQLAEAGIIQKTVQGRQIYYRANRSCPIFGELQRVVLKTAGLADVLRSALKPLAKKIRAAFVYGSLAASSVKAESDVDLMVIGSCDFGEVVDAVGKAQEQIGREVNPSVYPVDEFQKKLKASHHFLKTVMAGEKIFLIGDADELARLV